MDGATSRVLGLGQAGYASPPKRSIGRGGYCGWGNDQPPNRPRGRDRRTPRRDPSACPPDRTIQGPRATSGDPERAFGSMLRFRPTGVLSARRGVERALREGESPRSGCSEGSIASCGGKGRVHPVLPSFGSLRSEVGPPGFNAPSTADPSRIRFTERTRSTLGAPLVRARQRCEPHPPKTPGRERISGLPPGELPDQLLDRLEVESEAVTLCGVPVIANVA
jgi:hypothetical protein